MVITDIDNWMDNKGKKFLMDIGMKKNQSILDFGCGHGNYTIPASLVVGEKGRVYSVDKNQESLNRLIHKANERGLKNIIIIKLIDQQKLTLYNNSVDMILLFDVLHLVENRKRLLTELKRILKPNGILSVYPKHHQTHMNMTLEEVIRDIQSVGLCFKVKLFKTLMHDDQLEKGYVVNFKLA
jgi:ubiquinone/menaquinone biosynthesis C-methylase UbiE